MYLDSEHKFWPMASTCKYDTTMSAHCNCLSMSPFPLDSQVLKDKKFTFLSPASSTRVLGT